eukprot:Hpha_TRINITY_DN11764_c0_g1::TRINITY_DN11764_c0_g1_i1::g.31615::m.31615
MSSEEQLRAQGHTIIKPVAAARCHASTKLRPPQTLYRVATSAGEAWECLPDSRCDAPPCNGAAASPITQQRQLSAAFAPYPTAAAAAPTAATIESPGYDALVDIIKQGQRHNDTWRRAWAMWCQKHAQGCKDPLRLTEEQLVLAVRDLGDPTGSGLVQSAGQYFPGLAPPVKVATRTHGVPTLKPGRPAVLPPREVLVATIKDLQRNNSQFRDMWNCLVLHHGGARDPNRHEAGLLYDAIDIHAPGKAEQIIAELRNASEPGQSPAGEGGEAKNPALQITSGPEHFALVEKIKVLQRTDDGFRMRWVALTDAEGGGRRDPSRHNLAFLQAALSRAAPTASGVGDVGALMSPADASVPQVDLPEPTSSDGGLFASWPQEKLVEQIKELQRNDAGFREAWVCMCQREMGGSRDPARHRRQYLASALDRIVNMMGRGSISAVLAS